MRCFVAIFFNEQVTKALRNNQTVCKAHGITGSYVKTENIHLTVKFIGELDEQSTFNKLSKLNRELKGLRPMDLCLSNLGVFPRRGKPRVLWQGLEGNDIKHLEELHKRVDDYINRELGIPKETRRFSPHVTLIRNPTLPKESSIKDLSKLDIQKPDFLVNGLSIMKSELTPKGPIYTELDSILF